MRRSRSDRSASCCARMAAMFGGEVESDGVVRMRHRAAVTRVGRKAILVSEVSTGSERCVVRWGVWGVRCVGWWKGRGGMGEELKYCAMCAGVSGCVDG